MRMGCEASTKTSCTRISHCCLGSTNSSCTMIASIGLSIPISSLQINPLNEGLTYMVSNGVLLQHICNQLQHDASVLITVSEHSVSMHCCRELLHHRPGCVGHGHQRAQKHVPQTLLVAITSLHDEHRNHLVRVKHK